MIQNGATQKQFPALFGNDSSRLSTFSTIEHSLFRGEREGYFEEVAISGVIFIQGMKISTKNPKENSVYSIYSGNARLSML